jgi:hypothetical protein
MRMLQVVEGAVQLFKQCPDCVWPGYDLSSQPFIVYRPDKWALLIGHDDGGPDFSEFPPGWPIPGHRVLFHEGTYGNLAGQLAFDLPLEGIKTLAIGLPDSVPAMRGYHGRNYESFALGYIVHEAFHQYQSEAFGEIPWAREERYPILSAQNNALATLEMRILAHAMAFSMAGRTDLIDDFAREFVAVRTHRWEVCDPFVRRLEQSTELKEGTAQYVQVRALEQMAQLDYNSRVPAEVSLPEKLAPVPAHALILDDLPSRMTAHSVAPEDMPRNRIYPVGAAQALLLDDLGVRWKSMAELAGSEFTYVELLRDITGYADADGAGLLEKAKTLYGFDSIVTATDSLIAAYQGEYAAAMSTFEDQQGTRLEITTPRSGVGRSRVTSRRKWLMDSGSQLLCLSYDVYALESEALLLQVTDAGVLEENDWGRKTRTVIVYSPGLQSLKLDGEEVSVGLAEDETYSLESIELETDNIVLSYTGQGSMEVSGAGSSLKVVVHLGLD